MPTVTKVKVAQDKNNADYKSIELSDKRRIGYVKFGHPLYNSLQVGYELSEGDIFQDGEYKGFPSYKLKEDKKPYPKKASNDYAQQKEKSDIFTASSIKTSSTSRDANAIVTALVACGHYKDRGNDFVILKHDIAMWRKHFWKNWDFVDEATHFESDTPERFEPNEEEEGLNDS